MVLFSKGWKSKREKPLLKLINKALPSDLDNLEKITTSSKKIPDSAINAAKQKIGIFTVLTKYDVTSRKEFIKNIKDQSSLNIVVEFEDDEWVREVAVKNMKDENVLTQIAKTDKSEWVRATAVKKINNQKLLIEIYNNDSHWMVRSGAVQKITDEIKLIEIAKTDNDESTRKAALENISDLQALINAALFDESVDVRKTAVRKIKDEKVLYEIIKNETINEVKSKAVQNISSHDLLVDILKTETDYVTRKIAYSKITDKNAINHILIKDSDYRIRKLVYGEQVDEINDEKILKDIAINEYDAEVLGKTLQTLAKLNNVDENIFLEIAKKGNFELLEMHDPIKFITDENVLKSIAENEFDEKIRKTAIKKIADQDILISVFINDVNVEIRSSAFLSITDTSQIDQQQLIELLDTKYSDEVRIKAIKSINDKKLLKELAIFDSRINLRQNIFNALKDEIEGKEDKESLAMLATNTNDFELKKHAISKIGDEEFLANLALNGYERVPYLSLQYFAQKYCSQAEQDLFFKKNEIEQRIEADKRAKADSAANTEGNMEMYSQWADSSTNKTFEEYMELHNSLSSYESKASDKDYEDFDAIKVIEEKLLTIIKETFNKK